MKTPLSLIELNELSLMVQSKVQGDLADPDEVYAIVKGYFDSCVANNHLPTMTGMALTLGVSRAELLGFYSDNPDIRKAVDQAKLIIIEYVERLLLSGRPPIGLIFWLKNNDNWIDKTEITHSDKKMSDILDEMERKGELIKSKATVVNSNPIT